MTKVVYNTCCGGFGLSDAAKNLYLKLKGIDDLHSFYDDEGFVHFFKVKPPENYKFDCSSDFNLDYEFNFDQISRDDPELIQVVESLGEEANDDYSWLEVEDLPVGTLYRITECDGYETVETQCNIDWKVA